MYSRDLCPNSGAKRIVERLELLADSAGGRKDGVNRYSFTHTYAAGMKMVQSWMEEAGLTVEVDGIGNMIGTFPGLDMELPPVRCGSHLDSVPCAGMFDGILGVISAIECAQSWKDSAYSPKRRLEVISFIEEEGSVFGAGCLGARYMAGTKMMQNPEAVKNGDKSLRDVLSSWDMTRETPYSPGRGSAHAYLEMHIEQGPQLWRNKKSVGVVKGIVGILKQDIKILGESNHAGTTPMADRRDALVRAAELIGWIDSQARASGGNLRTTVGDVTVQPGARNVIAREAVIHMEARSGELETLQRFSKEVVSRAAAYGPPGEHDAFYNLDQPIMMNERLVRMLTDFAAESALPFEQLWSWAGHDAKIMAEYCPTAMIFVPSAGGYSHSTLEDTEVGTIGDGLMLLEKALKTLCSEE